MMCGQYDINESKTQKKKKKKETCVYVCAPTHVCVNCEVLYAYI